MVDKRYLIIDGLDGAGKSTVIEAAKSWFAGKKLSVFDATAWSKQQGRLAALEDAESADALFTAEPTYVGTGAAIRHIVLPVGSTYSTRNTAEAYALDRDMHCRDLVHPFLERFPEKWVIQERGLISSLAYQPLQSLRNQDTPPMSQEEVFQLPGNQTSLRHAPCIFIFLDIDASTAQKRLHARRGTEPEDIFDNQGFQAALRERYLLPRIQEPWTSQGTRIVTIDGSQDKNAVEQEVTRLFTQIASE